ncbi:hypothetical protein JD969_09770 [Planctomycetota bacterium]|nr:hypothetical protein JD969_09770 [Planctomycetota bacterium]
MRKVSDIMDELSWDERKSIRHEVTRRTRNWVVVSLTSFFVLALLRLSKVEGVDWLNWLLFAIAAWSVWMCINKRKDQMVQVLKERGHWDAENDDQ